MPHASAALKQLRADGLVSVDQRQHRRGAIQRLSDAGWRRLELDEKSRLKQIDFGEIPSGAVGCLLARDGPMLLLGYLKPQPEAVFSLPSKPLSHLLAEDAGSTGKGGVSSEWCWAVAREARLRWFSLPDIESIPEPDEEGAPQGITEWAEANVAIGIARARLLEPENPFALSVGSWFGDPAEDEFPSLPPVLDSDEGWTLGRMHSRANGVRPQQLVVAEMERRLGVNLLLGAAGADGLVIAEAGLLGRQGQALPAQILMHWIKRVHPKLSEKSQHSRLGFLQNEIGIGSRQRRRRRTSGEQATWTRFRRDWAEAAWTDESSVPNSCLFDNTNLGEPALLAMFDWVIAESRSMPLTVQWPSGTPLSRTECERLSRFPELRLIIAERWLGSRPKLLLRNSRFSALPVMDLHIENGPVVPVNIESHTDELIGPTPELWTLQEGLRACLEASNLLDSTGVLIEDDTIQFDYTDLVASCRSFPAGDEDLANRSEMDSPLCAWIASPAEHRWARWQRVGQRVDGHWVELMDPTLVPITRFGEVGVSATPAWRSRASILIGDEVRQDPDLVMGLRSVVLDSPPEQTAWWFGELLPLSAWLAPSVRSDLLEHGLSAWTAHPGDDCNRVLEALDWLETMDPLERGHDFQYDWRARLFDAATQVPENHPLAIWQDLVNWLSSGRTPSLEGVMSIVTSTPPVWWASVAEPLLSLLMEEPEGREFLISADVCWSVQILQGIADASSVPGHGRTLHPGCGDSLLEKLDQLLSRIEERPSAGSAQLSDLRDSLRCARRRKPPRRGRVHANIGWLAQQLSRWPRPHELADPDGDPRVEARLMARKSGFHVSLERPSQLRIT